MYLPAEDSYLLQSVVKQWLSDKDTSLDVLDMGSGSGIQVQACMDSGIPRKNILAVDIDPEAITYLKNHDIPAITSDLFSKIKGKFDLIIFNPPYLPEHPNEKGLDTTGGKKGNETILKFLKQAKPHLKKNGSILLLFSSLSRQRTIIREAKKDYTLKIKATKKLFFEELFVYELRALFVEKV